MEAQQVDTDRSMALYGPLDHVEDFDEYKEPSVVAIQQIRSTADAATPISKNDIPLPGNKGDTGPVLLGRSAVVAFMQHARLITTDEARAFGKSHICLFCNSYDRICSKNWR
jgi:hypothetical protein